MNSNSLVIKQTKIKKQKYIYMKIEFQNPVVRFVPYNGHKKCLDNPCWDNILYFE